MFNTIKNIIVSVYTELKAWFIGANKTQLLVDTLKRFVVFSMLDTLIVYLITGTLTLLSLYIMLPIVLFMATFMTVATAFQDHLTSIDLEEGVIEAELVSPSQQARDF